MSRSSKLRLVGGVSTIALAVALGGTAHANAFIPRDIPLEGQGRSVAAEAIYAGDPLIELTLRSRGRLTTQSIAEILPLVVGPLTVDKAEALPALMEGIRSMGLGYDVEASALRTLSGLIAAAAGKELNEDRAARLVAEVADQFAAKVQLAKVQDNPGTGRASDQGKSHNNNNGRGNGTYSG